ncbi:hypothetical protein [Salinicola endophyticus]|nr:hypothetical protein [Salinicola endophyticus]
MLTAAPAAAFAGLAAADTCHAIGLIPGTIVVSKGQWARFVESIGAGR